ncbi:MAG: SusC/RagA family TonB-linked outer membrane protein, partial [Bacteroidaceae bacterium]
MYGSAANNGVIIITTKGGREGKIRVDVSSNITMETPLMYPKQQKEFAPRIDGSTINYDGWGGRIADLTDDELATYPYLTRNPRNNITDYFKTGQTYNNSVSLSGGTEHSSTYFSYGNTVQKGMMDKNKFVRHNLLFKESYNVFNNRLKLDLSLNYITQKTNNRPIIGLTKSGLPGLYCTPSAVDLRYFDKNRTHVGVPGEELTSLNSHLVGENLQTFPWLNQAWINNPYFMLDAIEDEAARERIIASFSAKVDIYKGLTAQARVSLDKRTDDNVSLEYASIRGANTQSTAATYWGGAGTHREIYSDYLLSYNKQIKNISVSATVGTSFKRIKDRSTHLSKFNDSTYVKPNLPYPDDSWNGTDNALNAGGILGGGDASRSNYWETAVFATAQVGFWSKGYIDVSFRNDWAKPFQQFAKKGEFKSFPYYSVGGNLLIKELIPLDMPQVNSMKLRASYSVVGNSIPDRFYRAQTVNPQSGKISARAPSFDNPKPETTKAIELGLDGALFNNKLDFDITLYQTIMENQFLEYSTPGGERKPVNSGQVRNRGIEFSGNYHMKFGRDFRWSTGLNLAYNDNKILKTVSVNGESVEVNIGSGSSLSIIPKFLEGGSYGDLYSTYFEYKKDKNTKLPTEEIKIVDGNPVFTSNKDKFIG